MMISSKSRSHLDRSINYYIAETLNYAEQQRSKEQGTINKVGSWTKTKQSVSQLNLQSILKGFDQIYLIIIHISAVLLQLITSPL